MGNEYKPYRLTDADTFYYSGDVENGPYKALKAVVKAARAAQIDPAQITVSVQYVPSDGKEAPYWAATATASS